MITVGELVHSVSKDDVLAALARLYKGKGEDPEGYASMFDELLDLQPLPTEISCLVEPWGADSFNISGIIPGEDTHYAIEFVDWREWLSMPVLIEDSMGEISQAEMLAHVMAELAWAGYTYRDATDHGDDIRDRADEVREAIEDGTIEQKTVSLDEILNRKPN